MHSKTHLLNDHNLNEDDFIIKETKLNFYCKHKNCNKVFAKRRYLKIHEKRHVIYFKHFSIFQLNYTKKHKNLIKLNPESKLKLNNEKYYLIDLEELNNENLTQDLNLFPNFFIEKEEVNNIKEEANEFIINLIEN